VPTQEPRPAVVGESAASCRDLSALGGTFVLAVCFTGPASGAGGGGVAGNRHLRHGDAHLIIHPAYSLGFPSRIL